MSAIPRRLVVALLPPLVACSSMDVRSHRAPAADLTGFRSYAWAEAPGSVEGDIRMANNPLVDARIRETVEREMRVRGWRLVAAPDADLRLAYHAALEGKLDVETFYDYYPYARRRGFVVSRTESREYDQGTLVLDLIDGASGEVVWRGSAQAELHSQTREYRRQKLEEAVRAILDRLAAER